MPLTGSFPAYPYSTSVLETALHFVHYRDENRFGGGDIVASAEYMKVFIDGRLVTDHAAPFSASDSEIVLYEDTGPPVGAVDTLVRALDGYVAWLTHPVKTMVTEADYNAESSVAEIPIFEAAAYERAVGRGHVRFLPSMADDVFGHFVEHIRLPSRELVLYGRSNDQDVDVTNLVRAVNHLFGSSHIKTATTPVRGVCELQIGLDLPGFPEAQWSLGLCPDGRCFRLKTYPLFPVWFVETESFLPSDLFEA